MYYLYLPSLINILSKFKITRYIQNNVKLQNYNILSYIVTLKFNF